MNEPVKYGSMKYPEQPVKLSANEQVAEYGSDVIAEIISGIGFSHVFLLPGSSFRGLHDSLVNHLGNRDPELIMANHEAIVVAMAHGYAKASGRTGLCIVHDLVGLMCASVSVFNAWVDRVPILILGGSGPQDPARRRPIDWTHTASMQGDLVKNFTKWTAEPPTLQATVDTLLRANKVAATEPRGPAYVSLDLGVQEDLIPEGLVIPDPALPRYRPAAPAAANAGAIEEAADMLLAADLPLIVGGRFGREAETGGRLAALVELCGAAYVDDRAIVCLPTAHPQNLNGDEAIRREADVVLAIDCVDATSVADAHNEDRRGRDGQKIIEISVENQAPHSWSSLGGLQAAVALQVVCDPAQGMDQLIAVLTVRRQGAGAAGEKIAARKKVLGERHAGLRQTQQDMWQDRWDDMPICGGRLIFELFAAVRARPWVLTVRNHRSFAEGFWDFTGAGQYLGADGGGGVGYGPGAAVGAALAYRDAGKLCVAIIGDGDFQMGSGAVWTAVHYKIPTLLVINNNNSWGNDEHHQINIAKRRGRPVENAWIGQRMVEPATDFAAVCRGYGAWAEGPIEDPNDLAGVFERAVAAVEAGETAIVDVRTAL